MRMLNTSLSLNQIEEELERQLREPKNYIRILGDLELSMEDYQYLLFKIRGLKKYQDHPEFFERFRLSILTLWIFTLRMKKGGQSHCKQIREELQKMNQYHVRRYVTMMLDAFGEYGLNVFGMSGEGTVDGLLELLVIHTGIPENLQDDFCHLLDDSLAYGEFSVVESRFFMRLPLHMQQLYSFVKRDVVVQMVDYSRKMFLDYRLNGITCREAYEKYPLMSSNLMKGCFRWCEAQEMYAKNFG